MEGDGGSRYCGVLALNDRLDLVCGSSERTDVRGKRRGSGTEQHARGTERAAWKETVAFGGEAGRAADDTAGERVS